MREEDLKQEVSVVEKTASEVVICNKEQFDAASDFVKKIKSVSKAVEEYWEPLRKSSYDVYKEVMAKKDSMAKPLKAAETEIKRKMSGYLADVERQKREAEEAARKAAAEEAARKLAEAKKAEEAGDVFGAEMAKVEAEVLMDTAQTITMATVDTKVDGIVQRKSWEIVSVDNSAVPISFDGVELRPVDTSAVLALIKASKGTIKIPGIAYKEVVNVAVRI